MIFEGRTSLSAKQLMPQSDLPSKTAYFVCVANQDFSTVGEKSF